MVGVIKIESPLVGVGFVPQVVLKVEIGVIPTFTDVPAQIVTGGEI